MVPIALFCFAFAGIGLLGLNVWYYRALVNARHDADAYCALAQSWQQTAALAVDAMERARQKRVATSTPPGRNILDSILGME
jgi:hypothetical protein